MIGNATAAVDASAVRRVMAAFSGKIKPQVESASRCNLVGVTSGVAGDRGGVSSGVVVPDRASIPDYVRLVRLSARDHAKALLVYVQARGIVGEVLATDLRDLHREMCELIGLSPRPWSTVSSALRADLRLTKLRPVEGRRRLVSFVVEADENVATAPAVAWLVQRAAALGDAVAPQEAA